MEINSSCSMMPSLPKTGIDIVEVGRFRTLLRDKKPHALSRIFLTSEIAYCTSHKDPAPHFAGMFAAKEAVSKALGVTKYPFSEIEIRHTEEGAPSAYHKGRRLRVSISISHTASIATAIAVG